MNQTLSNNAHAPKFQYLVEEDIEAHKLSRLGLEGWELVNFASYSVGFGIGGNSSMKVHLRYIFKRPAVNISSDGQGWLERLADLHSRRSELASMIEARGYTPE